MTEVNADFLDYPLCFVAFSCAVLQKAAHLHSCNSQHYYRADASGIGIELMLSR